MIDIIAGITELSAQVVVGRKNRWGWILHLISGGLWTYIAFQTKLYGILIITTPAIFINTWNFIKWSKK